MGAGKSNTRQVLIEEAIEAGWAVVVIDVEGEYVGMNKPTDDTYLTEVLRKQYKIEPKGIDDFKVYVPASGETVADAATKFKVPISELDVFVLADILEMAEPQIRMFGKVSEKATRDNASSGRGSQGNMGNFAPPSTTQPSTAKNYTLQDMIDYLDEGSNGTANPKYQSLRLGTTETSPAFTLKWKLIGLGRSGMLDWNKNNATNYLPIQEITKAGRLSVIDVSETDDRSRNIAISYVLQSLFNRVIEYPVGENMPNGEPRPKIMVVLEEVHTFVSRSSVSKMRAVLDNLQLISRRGRKRWMSLVIVSQQPGHVPDELFELANTRFIHQLKSASNLAPVKQTTGGVHEALWSTMPSLGPGQCLLTGAVFKNPLFVNMRPAKTRRLLTN